PAPAPAPASARRDWPAPLNRSVAFRAQDLSLRDALDRLSASSRIRISYSAELLPLERRVCVSSTARTVGDALAELLRDTPVEPVIAGADHVVLALRRVAAADTAEAEFSRTVSLDRIVVTGSAAGAAQRTLPVALDVIGGQQLERRHGTAPLARVLSATGAGPWAWEQPPSSLTARYGSIRGASSFGVSAPKVFIDGIEVANPLLVTQIAPEAVERIEVIRGPQGAALYGTDAISGVVNIITRHEGTDAGTPQLRVRGDFGMARSAFAAGGALAQEHAVSLRAGTSMRSAGLDVAYGGVGDVAPEGGSRYLLASGSARQVGARSIATGIARFYAGRAGPADNPVLAAVQGPLADSGAVAGGQRLLQYTLGGTLKVTPGERWTHTLTAGIDGDRLREVPGDGAPLAGPVEGTAEGGADRATLRLSSVGRVADGARADLSVTLAAEHSALRQELVAEEPQLHGGQPLRTAFVELRTWMHSTALVAQGNAALDGRLHLTAGMRLERNDALAGIDRHALLPVLGVAWVTESGDATPKLRGAYGKGMRPVATPGREQRWRGMHARTWNLRPEEQSGIEAGFDLDYRGILSLQVTAFDQLASGLVQRVSLPAETRDGVRQPPRYALQSLGEITNRGWEVQGTAALGPLSLAGAMSWVDSRVRQLAAGYTGDLQPGDRMLEVPARTAALTAEWRGRRGTLSVTGYRAFDWINYDQLQLARDVSAGTRPPELTAGSWLRSYWRQYPGVTRLNATASLGVRDGLVLVLTGENLLDYQRGEPDNVTIVPGRTLTLGFRAEF
ncbi:MAG TPA: TonB-dependent receptor, partial [Longimicrobium sp.]|nr:TonB-dependent receptor [Longimicrobium sp.]